MSSKTPSSLKWLITKRSTLAGKLTEARHLITAIDKQQIELQEEVSRLEKLLTALDQTIGLHEFKIDPTCIAETRTSVAALFGHGKITKMVLSAMRCSPQHWFTTGELIEHICSAGQIHQGMYDADFLRRLVRRRLRGMAKQGVLERNRVGNQSSEQRWRLSATAIQIKRRSLRQVEQSAEA